MVATTYNKWVKEISLKYSNLDIEGIEPFILAKDLDIDFSLQDVNIEDSRLYRLWIRPKKVKVSKPLGPPPGLEKSPSYRGFCFQCNRYGHKPSYANRCFLIPMTETDACKKAKDKIRKKKEWMDTVEKSTLLIIDEGADKIRKIKKNGWMSSKKHNKW